MKFEDVRRLYVEDIDSNTEDNENEDSIAKTN